MRISVTSVQVFLLDGGQSRK